MHQGAEFSGTIGIYRFSLKDGIKAIKGTFPLFYPKRPILN